MSTTSNSERPPTKKQLSYLRSLALSRGASFSPPKTRAQASAEIDRLKRRGRSSYVERRIEREQVRSDMAMRGDAAAVRGFEIVGYGSSARWR
jgi:hypothetical protein